MSAPVEYRGIPIRTFDVPSTPFVWVHEESDGHGSAETLDEACAQIDRHLSALTNSGA